MFLPRSKSTAVLVAFALAGQVALGGLVGWWPLAESAGPTAPDASGVGNDGTLVTASGASGSPAWVNDAERGQVLALDGHGDVQVTADFSSITSEMSVSIWAKGNSSLTSATAFTALDGGTAEFNATVPWNSRRIRFVTPGGFHQYRTGSNANIRDNWRHWVFVVNGTTGDYAIYLDGVLESGGNYGSGAFQLDGIDTLHLGSDQGLYRHYDGRLSDVRVYNHELSFQEIQDLFNPGNEAPVAAADDYIVQQDTLRSVDPPGVLGNDLDPNGDPITTQLVDDVQHGTLVLATDGSFTYLPATGYTGPDQFTYRAFDGELQSAPATVTLDVRATGAGGLTGAEVQQIETDLGVTLSVDDQLALGAIVKPVSSPQWRTDAQARIEQHRKADLQLEVVDALGLPVPNADVAVTLRRKAFRFGGIMDLKKFAGVTPIGVSTTEYKDLFLKLYDHAGLNNGLKPKLRAGNEALPGFFSWAQAQDLGVRGHLLIWPGGTHLSSHIEALVSQIEQSSDPVEIEALKPQLQQAVYDEITEWAGLWSVSEWDVMNEVLSNRRIQDILGDQEMIEWFNLAETNAVQPGCRLLINEFQIISARSTGTSYASRSTDYKWHIDYLLNGTAPLDSIGFQSRFKFEHPDPAALYQRLEEFATYGLPMVGTEFEVKDLDPFLPSEELRGQMTEEIMTTYFSHPLMDGLYAWTYLEDDTKAMVADDGTVKLNGLVWYYLNRIRYHTAAALLTDVSGQAALRGFKGDYEVTVTVGGQTYETSLSLEGDGPQQVVIPYNTPGTSQISPAAIEDAHCRESIPDGNFGGQTTLQLRAEEPSGFTRRVFLKFDVAGTTGTIVNAQVRLTSNDLDGVVEAYAVADNSWQEDAITWNTMPAIGSLLGSATATAGEAFEIDVTGAVTEDGTISFVLRTLVNPMFKLWSSESADPPELVITMQADSDGDGIDDDWERAHAPDLGVMDETTDTDGDGLLDLGEFLAGTDPNDPRDYFRITSIGPDPGGIRLAWNSKPGTSYRVWKSPTLAPGNWQIEVTSIEATGEATTVPLSEPTPAMFYRVEILLP